MGESRLLSAIGFLLSFPLRLFTSITVPGTDFHFGSLYIGIALMFIALRFLFGMFGLNHADKEEHERRKEDES